jgi:hypothetical protein
MATSALYMPFGGWAKHLTPSLCMQTVLHHHAHNFGGIACPDPKLQAKQQKAVAEWVALLGKRLFTGNSLARTPAPVAIFEPRRCAWFHHCQRAAAPSRRLAERFEASRNLLDNLSCCFGASKLRMLGSTQTMLT